MKTDIFPAIRAQRIRGYRGIQLHRRDLGSETEFVTVMWFDSLSAVKVFSGSDYEAAVVPARARELLSRFDDRSAHYEVRESQMA